jgi:hypothetical protein
MERHCTARGQFYDHRRHDSRYGEMVTCRGSRAYKDDKRKIQA